MKVFDFILENKDVIFANGLFSLDTLEMIRAIVRGKVSDNFKLNTSQKLLIIDAFKCSKKGFNKDTPSFVIEDLECIKIAISNDINSIDYIKTFDLDIVNYIIGEAINKKFILKENSSNFLKSNFLIVLESIKLDVKTADFVDWYSFDKKESDVLVDEVIKFGYTLSSNSHMFLTNNLKVVLDSIKKDINNIDFANDSIRQCSDVFKYLLSNGYSFPDYYIKNKTLNSFLDKDILYEALKKINIYDCKNEKYLERISKLFNDGLNSRPLIKLFDPVFDYVSEQKWREHRQENAVLYNNIFGKICSELRNSASFTDAVCELSFLNEMEEILETKYKLLYNSMREYFDIYHSLDDNKLEKLGASKDMIADLSALYVAKCKEFYKKETLKLLHDYIKPYFTLNFDNSYVNNKLILSRKRKQFKIGYVEHNKDIRAFLEKIIKNYNKFLDDSVVREYVFAFIFDDCSIINELTFKPIGFDDYLRYEKAIKLINRLNNGYIKYDDVEVLNYKDIISLDKDNNQYFYSGIKFCLEDLKFFADYKKKMQVFDKIKKDIMIKVKEMEFDGKINDNDVLKLINELPFTDDYFIFDTKKTIETFSLSELIYSCKNYYSDYELDSILCDESFNNIYNLMVNNGMMWLLVFMNCSSNKTLFSYGIRKDNIMEMIDNMVEIIECANNFKFDLNDFSELMLAFDISQCSDNEAMAILGKEIIEKLYKFTDYTENLAQEIVSMAKELICEMVKRSKSTVPYVSGKYLNYNYSMYDSHDSSILHCGIDTDSCFRVDGNDNDFLHYCALDKNGFVIKITDDFGNFIARAAGFRNGNCVFINQLRTVYDEGGNHYCCGYNNEKNDIIETFKMACMDIVNISQSNAAEVDKIDFVFVTQSYALDNYKTNVIDEVVDAIGSYPIDMFSDDWKYFINNTSNLQEADLEDGFTTDYGEYPLICMASYIDVAELKPDDLELRDVPAMYARNRNRVIITNNIDMNVYQKINKIKAIHAFFNETEYIVEKVDDNSIVFVGDNWYIIYCNGKVVGSCLLDFDDAAKIEFNAFKMIIDQYIMNDNYLQLNIEEKILELDMHNCEKYVRVKTKK